MNILVVDDHALFREGLTYVLDTLSDDVTIIEASNSNSAMKLLAETPALDLILVDINMPGEKGFSLLDTCHKTHATTPVVIISASEQQQDIQQAINLGAMGYIHKNTTSKVMIGILNVILAGGVYFPQLTATRSSSFSQNEADLAFTPRQLQVLSMMSEGLSNKVIATQMNIAEATIKMHVTAIFKKLAVTNRTQAALVAKEKGLVTAQ